MHVYLFHVRVFIARWIELYEIWLLQMKRFPLYTPIHNNIIAGRSPRLLQNFLWYNVKGTKISEIIQNFHLYKSMAAT